LIASVPAQLITELPADLDQDHGSDRVEDRLKRKAQMPNRAVKLTYGVMLAFGLASLAQAQDNAVQPPSARQQLQHIHTPQSIDQELVRLTTDLELTPEQQQQVKPLLEEHHNRIQALLDKNPNASRQELGPQIHGISDETHREIHTLLSNYQKELEKAMQQRKHKGEENRRSAPPATASPEPSPSAS
jgi:Spy/CpxP family protein refolding chaperone